MLRFCWFCKTEQNRNKIFRILGGAGFGKAFCVYLSLSGSPYGLWGSAWGVLLSFVEFCSFCIQIFCNTHGPGAARTRTRGGTAGSNRGPATRTRAPPDIEQQGPGRRQPLRNFDRGIGDRRDCQKIPSPACERTGRGGVLDHCVSLNFQRSHFRFPIFKNYTFLTFVLMLHHFGPSGGR